MKEMMSSILKVAVMGLLSWSSEFVVMPPTQNLLII
jgi:hypothetical protein